MSVVTLADVRQAAIIIGTGITDEPERAAVAEKFAALFGTRFYTLDRNEFLSLVERVAECPQDYEGATGNDHDSGG